MQKSHRGRNSNIYRFAYYIEYCIYNGTYKIYKYSIFILALHRLRVDVGVWGLMMSLHAHFY